MLTFAKYTPLVAIWLIQAAEHHNGQCHCGKNHESFALHLGYLETRDNGQLISNIGQTTYLIWQLDHINLFISSWNLCNKHLLESQLIPLYPAAHLQENMFDCGVEHVPPFSQGLLKHSSMSTT